MKNRRLSHWSLNWIGYNVKINLSAGMAVQEISHNLLCEVVISIKVLEQFTQTRKELETVPNVFSRLRSDTGTESCNQCEAKGLTLEAKLHATWWSEAFFQEQCIVSM